MTEEDLIQAFGEGDSARVREIVVQHPDLARVRKDGVSLLLQARYRNDRAMTEAIRTAGVPLDVFEAAAFDDVARLSVLLRDDTSAARSWNGDGFTLLHLSAFFGGADGARLLLDAGAELDVVSRNDFSVYPIHSAAAGRVPVALLLVERGANVNVRQRHGWTPLHSAAHNGSVDLVDALLAAGADPEATNDDGVTALDLARKAGHDAIVERLQAVVGVAQ
jgi:ankyrin repeat protein